MFHIRRLRTQLILSHLIAIACTLVAMVVAVVWIGASWYSNQRAALGEPAQEAQTVAYTIGGLIPTGKASADLNPVLRALASGGLRVNAGMTSYAPPNMQRRATAMSVLQDVAYIAVISPEGTVLGSSKPEGAAFNPPERPQWASLVQAALTNPRQPQDLTAVMPGSQPAALGAYPVLGPEDQPFAVVILASRVAPGAPSGLDFWHSLVFAGAASAALLTGASVFALLSAGLISFWLSRRLTRRLESLRRAAEALAGGNLDQRVAEGTPDEVGQLARRFNAMAERLSEMVTELAAARDRTEAALKAKRELVANVSHELRTPLALIRGYVETLAAPDAGADPDRLRESLTVIVRETGNLSRLVDDLFALSTAEAGALPLDLEPVAIGEVVREVSDGLAPIARRERQITLATELPPDLPPVRADRQRVIQILGNLARNALRHTPEGGLIALRAEREGEWVVISVEDTGEGIPAEHLPHVFERFYRADESRDRASGGAGLGLAIVRELVEAMGGSVSVESAVGVGSRFSFRLPVARETDEATPKNEALLSHPHR